MSLLKLRPLLLLRSRASLCSNNGSSLTHAVRTQPACFQLPDTRVLYGGVVDYGSSAVTLQQHESGDRDEAEGSGEEGLSISDSCVKQLMKVKVKEEEPDLVLRVMVDGGGCSGFQYKIDFDTQVNSDDRVFERGGVSVVVDSLSLGLLSGCTVDYHTELIRSGFRVTGNPKAEASCSCGVSFAPKN